MTGNTRHTRGARPASRIVRRAASALCAALVASGLIAQPGEEVDMREMMAKARQFTQPGPEHEVLQRFVGDWTTYQRITMMGAETEPERGRSTCDWLMEGRWMKCEGTGTLMGMPSQTFQVLGYDRFKKSYVTVSMSTMDTAMLTSEGDMDPGGETLITYGTLDEYLTGEHDKMVKYVWRFLSKDQIVMEVHDLPIGETNTKVVEMRFVRAEERPAAAENGR